MLLATSTPSSLIEPNRRKLKRLDLQCRARIVIGTRHHAGYLSDISPGGAKLRTITPIARPGTVLLRLPDLPVLRCSLRWHDGYNAGVAFERSLEEGEFHAWLRTRSGFESHGGQMPLCEIVRAEPGRAWQKLA
ncbi:PilZ domain-containing protein [Sphingomonas arvum]|uniref:PilZ domain-containing protein n=1 Tax=Sphingomonas arvum TaxID=2992113 RepID=UPI0038B2DE13